jgi:GntR family transcriptional regulator/MocR family aminotransferase
LLPPVGRRLVQAAAEAMAVIRHRPFVAIDFMYGLSQPDERLLRELRRALGGSLRDRAFFYGPLGGNAALRQQIAGRLRGARGISRSADHIVLTSGTQQALDICARILLTAGDRVVTEDPGYEVAAAAFGAAGARIRYVPVDREGLNPGILPVGRSHRLIYVTPSHQFPTGAVMPIARRYALVEWARRTGAFIFEDDYDGEFRYAGQPIPALASIDPETVIYCGTFAKSLFPSCRLGYLVLPTALVAPAAQCKWLTDRGSSVLVERALGDLLATGDYDRHIRRMQRRYRDRRAALIHSLHAHLGRAVKVEGHSAGLHLVAVLPALPAERISAIVEVCRRRGVGVYPLASHAKRAHVGAALILGYGLLPVEQIDPGIRVLGEVYRHEMRRLKRTAAERQSGLTALTRKRT